MNKEFSILAVWLLISSIMPFWVLSASAVTQYQIIWPFWTGRENLPGTPVGRTNVVDYWKDFHGAEVN